jgi:hypothetical protein
MNQQTIVRRRLIARMRDCVLEHCMGPTAKLDALTHTGDDDFVYACGSFYKWLGMLVVAIIVG